MGHIASPIVPAVFWSFTCYNSDLGVVTHKSFFGKSSLIKNKPTVPLPAGEAGHTPHYCAKTVAGAGPGRSMRSTTPLSPG